MKCWRDDYEVVTIDTEHRYCPQCGARLFQNCPYCASEGHSEGISVYDVFCRNCRRSFRFCPKCYISYSIRETRCENCSAILTDKLPGCPTAFGNFNRNQIVQDEIPAYIFEGVQKERILSLTAGRIISQVVTRHGMIFFVTKVEGERGRIRAIHELRGDDVWHNTPIRSLNIAQARLSAYSKYITLTAGPVIYVDDILTGEEVANFRPEFERFQTAIIENSLILFGQKDGVIQVYDLSARGGSRQIFRGQISSGAEVLEKQPTLEPVVDESIAWIIDQSGRIIRVNGDGAHQVIWDNPEQRIILQIIAVEKTLHLLAKDEENFYLFRIDSDGRNVIPTCVTTTLKPSLPQVVMDKRYLFVCEPEQFCIYEISRPNSPVYQYQLVANSKISDFFVVKKDDEYNIIQLLFLISPARYSVYCITFYPDLPPEGSIEERRFEPILLPQNSNPQIIYSNGQVMACERMTGKIHFRRLE